jgi:hypothetical protein
MKHWSLVAVILGLVVAPPAAACSLCGGLIEKQTLRRDVEEAVAVIYGHAANPRFDDRPGARPGAGFTDFHIERVVKPHPGLEAGKAVVLSRYVPVLDAKNPPRFLVFYSKVEGQLRDLQGRSVQSPAVLKYLDGALAQGIKDRVQALKYFFEFLDHEDTLIATDAFLEFARSTDEEVGKAALVLPGERVRKLLQDPKTPTERLGLYAFLLGAGRGMKDAEFLRAMIDRPTERTASALDGLVSGYIMLRPQEGWDLAVRILGDGKRRFSERFAVARALRFYHGWKPAESRANILRGLEAMLGDGAVADMAISDLRQWKIWDLTPKVLALYGRPSHDAPIVTRGIVRYALQCPQPEARRFIDDLRRRDPELVKEVEESLQE